jgi:DNA-binding response OmpR family regulator
VTRLAPRALIVDDDAGIRRLVGRTLARGGFDVAEAEDGVVALSVFAAGRPFDVVVLDWEMPGPSGPEVLSELKRRVPDVAVIMLTAALEQAHGGLATVYGADAYLAKPFSPVELVETAERLVAERAADQPA